MLALNIFSLPSTSLAIVLFLLYTPSILAEIPCYYPDGFTIAPLHTPCNTSASDTPQSASSCCRNYANAYCVSNGLCYDEGVLSRGSCTDKTWKSPSCPQVCTTGLVIFCQFLTQATNYLQEHKNASLAIYNCKGQGTYQCGWGDCSTNFTDQNPFTIILRDDQKSAATSLPSKTSDTLAVGLAVGLSLGLSLLVSLYFLYRQRRQLKAAESTSTRNSLEKTWEIRSNWQWPHGQTSPSIIPGLHSPPPPPQSAHIQPARYETPPATLSAAQHGPPVPPKVPNQRGLQELRDQSSELHELDCRISDPNGTREFV